MTVYVTEHWGREAQERQSIGAPIASYSISSASTPTLPQPRTDFIRVSADAASLITFISTQVGATGQLTSTNAIRLPANVVERFQLVANSTIYKIAASST